MKRASSVHSHTIRGLEERLGAKLLYRTTRSVALTEAGQGLLDRLTPAFVDIAGVVGAVRAASARPSGRARLNLPKLAAELILAPTFGRFARAYPNVHLELMIDDGLTDVVAAGFVASIRPGERVHRDMTAVRVSSGDAFRYDHWGSRPCRVLSA